MKKRILAMIMGLLMFALAFGGCANKEETAADAPVAEENEAETANDQEATAAAEKIMKDFENLKKPDDVTTPEEFLEAYEAYVDFYVGVLEVYAEYPDNKEVTTAWLTTEILREWSTRESAIANEISDYSAKGEFYGECSRILEKAAAAIDEMIEKTEE